MLQLHPYQQFAVDWLHSGGVGRGLFLDMGLGKTAITLSALTPDHLPALVVAPKRVTEETWPVETQKWRPDLTYSLAAGPRQKREEALLVESDITLISRDNVASLRGHKAARRFKTIVIDELSSFKNHSSLRFRAMKVLTKQKNVEHVWGLTGTPAPNGLMDLWAQLFLLDHGERLGKNITSFRSRWFHTTSQLPNGVRIGWTPNEGAEEEIHSRIEDICMSMSSSSVGAAFDLPELVSVDDHVKLPPKSQRVYEQMHRKMVADLSLLGGEMVSAAGAAALSGKLSQITAGGIYPDERELHPDEWTKLHTAKLDRVIEIVEGTGSPVLVFYRFRFEEQMLSERLKELGIQFSSVRDPGAISAWNGGKLQVLLAHPDSAGHGLNLQHGGHTVVWSSLPWSLEQWRQGNTRVHRQGQRETVIRHVIIAEGTIDEDIQRVLLGKQTIEDALMSHLENPVW